MILDFDMEEDKKMVANFGGLEYTEQQMADVLGESIKVVQGYMNDKYGDFYKIYIQGKAKAQFEIDSTLLNLAQSGDLAALKEYDRRKRLRNKDE